MVQKLIKEVVDRKKVTLPNGSKVLYGSQKHIKYLEDMLNRLCHERNGYRRGSSTRADYSAACKRTKSRLQRAKRYAERIGEI